MSTYIIGDVHGCYDELMTLLAKVRFNRGHDRLIFVGDLINRGPKSLAVLRFIHSLGDQAQIVLGNHDISLIAYAAGVYHGRGTRFPAMMKARDSERLVDWLRKQPLLIHDTTLNIVVTHAGIPPRWSLEKAQKQARKAEKKLQGRYLVQYLTKAYASGSDRWHKDFDKYDKFRYRINGFSRLRYCHKNGEPDYQDKCPVGQQGQGLAPWFDLRQRLQNDGQTKLFFGHWAALGYYQGNNAICLDSGCVWGNKLSAMRVNENKMQLIQVVSKGKQ